MARLGRALLWTPPPELLRELCVALPRAADNSVKPPPTLGLASAFLGLHHLHLLLPPALAGAAAQQSEASAVARFLARTLLLVGGDGGEGGRVAQAGLAELAAAVEVAVRYSLDVSRPFVAAVEARADVLVAALVVAAPGPAGG